MFAAVGHADVGDRIARSGRSGVQLRRTVVPEGQIPVGSSKFGGHPDLPVSMPWPRGPKRELDFLAQLNASEVHAWGMKDVPASGLLLFFYDQVVQPWGGAETDRALWRVLHVPTEGLVRTRPPRRWFRKKLAAVTTPAARLVGVPRMTYLTSVLTLEEVEEETVNDQIEELQGAVDEDFDGEPKHMTGGIADHVQNPIFECAELDVFGEPAAEGSVRGGFDADRAAEARGWSLLLQLDSDDELGWCWGDLGMLYLAVPREELRAGRFEHACMQLQCY